MKGIILRSLVVLSLGLMAVSVASAATIDQMYVDNGYPDTYNPDGGGLIFIGSADYYVLSDGTSWNSGAGTYTTFTAHLSDQLISGDTITYALDFEIGHFVYRQTDYNAGDHSAQGELTTVATVCLTAEIDSSQAVSSGYLYLYSNEETWYGEPRFNYYSAEVGDWVPCEMTYTLQGGATFDEDTFSSMFSFACEGVVDFENAIPEPSGLALFMLAALLLRRRR